MSRAPESFWGARRDESLVGATPPTGHTASRWYAISALSEMSSIRLNCSRTAICVTRGTCIACPHVSMQKKEALRTGIHVGTTHLGPAPRIIKLGDVDANVRSNSNHVLAIGLGKGSRAVNASSTDWDWTAKIDKELLHFLDRSVQRGALDRDGFLRRHGAIVCESCVGHDAQTKRFGVLRKKGSCMARFGNDELVTPFGAVLRRRCIQRVRLFSEMLYPEGV